MRMTIGLKEKGDNAGSANCQFAANFTKKRAACLYYPSTFAFIGSSHRSAMILGPKVTASDAAVPKGT